MSDPEDNNEKNPLRKQSSSAVSTLQGWLGGTVLRKQRLPTFIVSNVTNTSVESVKQSSMQTDTSLSIMNLKKGLMKVNDVMESTDNHKATTLAPYKMMGRYFEKGLEYIKVQATKKG